MIPGHTLTTYRASHTDPAGKSYTVPQHRPFILSCACGWERSGERIVPLKRQYTRHLYDVAMEGARA